MASDDVAIGVTAVQSPGLSPQGNQMWALLTAHDGKTDIYG
jgi:hypothetical protein